MTDEEISTIPAQPPSIPPSTPAAADITHPKAQIFLAGLRARGRPAERDVPAPPASSVTVAAPMRMGLCRARTRAVALSWCSCARQAALRYSLINP